jgi:hypothetical protein
MVFQKQQPKAPAPEVPAGALSNLAPGTGGIVQLTPEDEVFVSDYAQQNGIPKAEALRRLLLHSQAAREMPPKPTTLDKGMDAIYQAQQLGFGSTDPNDAINMMGRSLALKNIGDAMKPDQDSNNKKGKISIEDIKELMYLKMMGTLAGTGEDNNKSSSILQDMKAENEKQRLFYEAKLKEQDDKLRDMLFEKKIQTLEETNTQNINGLTNQLADISQRIELYRNAPANPTPEQAKDAITHLEDLGKQVTRIKGVFGDLGIIPTGHTTSALTPPGREVYLEKDGTVNKTMYAVDKITGALEKGLDAWTKKKPEFERLEDTPPPAGGAISSGGQIAIQMLMSPEEYYNFLIIKPQLNTDEQNWLIQNQSRFLPPTPPNRILQPNKQQEFYEPPPVETAPVPAPASTQDQPGQSKGMIEKFREEEEEQIRRAQENGT